MENENKISYKIMANNKYIVFKDVYNDKIFYKIQMTQKNFDGTTVKYYRPIMFRKGVELDNNTTIIIKKGFETLRANKRDDYNPITALFIDEFEIVEDEEKKEELAYANFQDNLNDLPF